MAFERRLEPFREAIAGPSSRWLERWKAEGRPVVGFFCSYVPVEVLTAAGAMPYRFRGTGCVDSGSADTFMSSRTCGYVRHTLALALDGRLGFLDGQVGLNSCDHVRRAHDLWRHKTAVPFHGFLSVPRNVRDSLFGYYREEVERLASGLASHLGVELSREALAEAAALHDRARHALARVDRHRAGERPVLTGAEALAVTVASSALPPRDFLELVAPLLAELDRAEPGGPVPRARLVLAGGELDDPGIVSALEQHGARVVGDALCTGSRAVEAEVGDPGGDPLGAICRRTFARTPCARMIGNFPDRAEALAELVRERRADGVVLQRLKFCDPWGGEAHNLRLRLREAGVPLLVLEREYGMRHAGQIGTRVQAFLEMIEAGREVVGRAVP